MPAIRRGRGFSGIDFPPSTFPPFIPDSNIKFKISVARFLKVPLKCSLTNSDDKSSRRYRRVRLGTPRRATLPPTFEALGG